MQPISIDTLQTCHIGQSLWDMHYALRCGGDVAYTHQQALVSTETARVLIQRAIGPGRSYLNKMLVVVDIDHSNGLGVVAAYIYDDRYAGIISWGFDR